VLCVCSPRPHSSSSDGQLDQGRVFEGWLGRCDEDPLRRVDASDSLNVDILRNYSLQDKIFDFNLLRRLYHL
jgi:hypothetical protein